VQGDGIWKLQHNFADLEQPLGRGTTLRTQVQGRGRGRRRRRRRKKKKDL
jgi:hypothetical protein